MTMKLFFEPWERRPSHDDRLTGVFFGEFEDIVGEVLVINKLANNAADRVRRDSCAREDRDWFSNTGRAAPSASRVQRWRATTISRSSWSSSLASSEPRNSRSSGGSGASI